MEPRKRRTHQEYIDQIKLVLETKSREAIVAHGISQLMPYDWKLTPERIRQVLVKEKLLDETTETDL